MEIAKLYITLAADASSYQGTLQQVDRDTQSWASGMADRMKTLGTAIVAALSAAVVAVGGAIAGSIGVASEFEDAITILSIAAKGAGESFDSMRAAAMAVGADTSLVGVNASQAAEAMTTLYKAGMTTGEIFGDLNGYLAGNVELSGALRAAIDGAAASELDMNQAAMLAATSLATFGSEMITTEQRAQFVNMAMNNFVQAADASMASVTDLAMAMQNIGPTAAQFGISLQDTNTALAILSTRGVMGAEAGTALKSMFNNLLTPTAEVSGALNHLGVSLYNTDGTMRELPAIVADLSQALYGMNEVTTVTGGRTAEQNHQLELARAAYNQATDAIYKHNAGLKLLTDAQLQKYIGQQAAANAEIQRLGSITGTATTAMSQLTEEQRNYYIELLAGSYGMKAFSILLQEGAAGWTAMEKAIASAATIQEVAAARTKTFSGAMEALSGVVETIRIGIGSAFLPVLTSLARLLADMAAEALPYIVGAFEALGGALSMFFDAVMSGTPPIQAFGEAVAQLGAALGLPEEQVIILGAALNGFLTTVENVIGPIWKAITSFVSWKDVLAAVGIAIGSALIPALIWLVQAFAPIIATFAAVVLAVAALRNAFETNFLGIRDLALGLWSALQQVFEGIKSLLSGDTTAAMAAFRSAWETGWNAIVSFVQNAGDQIGQALAGLWQSIVAWFQGIDWGALGQMLVERFLAGMAALGELAASRWEGLLTSLTNFIQSVDWAAVGYTLVDLLGKGIMGAVGLIATAVSGIVTFIWNFITGTNWIELGINLVNAILDGLSSFVSGVGAKLGEWKQAIFDWAGAEDWSGVATKISEMVGDALGTARDAISSKLSEWQQAIFDWAGAEDWQGVAEHIAEGVGEKLGEAKDAVASQLSEWQEAIFDWADAEDWSGVAEHIAEMVGEKLGEAKDAITATLSEWQTAIFDWVGAEDWSDVAQKIAEMVGEALGDAADSVISTLDSWEQAIFDWGDAEDWGDVAESIAVSVGESLGEVSDKVTEKLSGWITAFTNWVSTVDWYQVGYDIMFKITDAFLDFKEAITEKISGWLTDIKTETEGYAWYEVGAYILLKIAESAAGLVQDWVQAVSAWISNIGSAVSQHLANLAQVGRDLVAGIAAGISAAVDLIQGAIAGVIGGAEPAARQASQSQSPSRLMMPVGHDLSAGVAVGITQGAGLVISAIQGVADQAQLEGVKAFGEAMTAIAEAIGAALSAALDIGSFGGTGEGFGAALEAMATMMAAIVTAVAEANTLSVEALEELGKFVEVAGEINDLLVQTADVTSYLAGWRAPVLEPVVASIEALAVYLNLITTALANANVFGLGTLEVLGKFVEVVGDIVEMIAPAIDALNVLGRTTFPDWEAFAHRVDALAPRLQRLVIALANANIYGLGALEILDKFIEVVGEIVEVVAPLIVMLNALGKATFPDWEAFVVRVDALAPRLQRLVIALANANIYGLSTLEVLGKFIEVVGDIVEMIAPAIDALNILGNATFPDWEAFAHRVDALAPRLQRLVIALANANIYGLGVLEILDKFIDVVGEIVDVIVPLVEMLNVLGNVTFPDWISFAHRVDALAPRLQRLVIALANANVYGLGALEVLGKFVEVVGDIVEMIAPAIDMLNMLGNATFPDWISFAHRVDALAPRLQRLVIALANANVFGLDALEVLSKFVEVVGEIVEMVEPAIEALNVLGNATFPDWTTFAASADLLAAQLQALVGAFEAANQWSAEALEALGAFVDVVGDIVDLVGDAIEALLAIAAYNGQLSQGQLAAFTSQLVAVVAAMATAMAQAAAQAGELINQAADFAESAEAILDVVEPGIEALAAVAQYEAVAGIRVAAAAFAEQLVAVVIELANAFNSAATTAGSAMAQAADFAENAEAILDVVEPGVEALAAVATYFPIAGIRVAAAAFGQQLVAVLEELVNAFNSAAANAGEAVAQAAAFAESAADILDVVEPGVEALAALATYVSTAGLAGAVQTFAADLVTVIMTLVEALQQAGLLANQAVTEAGEMAGAMEDIVSVVAPAVEAVVTLVGYTTVGGLKTNVQQFAADLVLVIQTLVDGLAQAGLLASQAVTEAGEMAKHIQDILKVVEPALHKDNGAITLIAKYVSDGALIQKTQQFTADLIAVTQILVDGLTTSALAAGVALAKAGEMAKSMKDLFDALKPAMDSIGSIAEYTSAAGLEQKAQQFTDDLIAVATILVTGLTTAADQLGAEAVSAAHAFAQSVSLMVARIQAVVESLNALGAIATPNIEPILTYIVTSADQITESFAAAGDIGQAVAYAEAFRANLAQLVGEVQAAVASLNALAGTGTTGSIGAALANIAASLENTEGEFAGAGNALAQALIDALAGGIVAGQTQVLQAGAVVLTVVYNAGMSAARGFEAVGGAISDAMADGILAGQNQVVGAVTQVVNAAIAAGFNEAKKAASIGQELIRAALAEINAGRGQMDAAGESAGGALIDGMARAILNGKSRLVNAIKDAVQAAVAAAEAALGIASPSRVAFELFDNFMKSAEIPLGDPQGLVGAIGRSTRAMVDEAARMMSQAAGLFTAPVGASPAGVSGAQPARLTQPALAAAPGPTGRPMGQPAPVYNFYGNWVVEGVQDGQGLLEQLAAIAAGARRQ